jgi:hypothetical protein
LTAEPLKVSIVVSSADLSHLVSDPGRFSLKHLVSTARAEIQDRRDAHERQRWLERQRALDFIRAAEHDVLELVVADYYRALGFGATRIDEGGIVDLELSDKSALILVSFGLWRSLQVNEATVAQFNQARVAAGAVRGIMITGSGFTWGAEDYARRNSIELVDGEGLLKMVASAPKKQQLRLRQRGLSSSAA